MSVFVAKSCLFLAVLFFFIYLERADLLVFLYLMFSCVFATLPYVVLGQMCYMIVSIPGPEVTCIKLELILKFQIKRNDWQLADICPQASNHFALF